MAIKTHLTPGALALTTSELVPDAPAPDAPAPDEWADLAAPFVMPDRVSGGNAPKDVLTTVPAIIRSYVETSLDASCKAIAKKATSTATRKRIPYDWRLQPVKDIAQGEKFTKLAIEYGKYRPANTTIPYRADGTPDGQITVRCGTPGMFRDVGGEWTAVHGDTKEGDICGVRFSARPFEARKDTSRVGTP